MLWPHLSQGLAWCATSGTLWLAAIRMLVYGCVSFSPWLLGWFLPPEWPALVGCASLFHATACALCCCNLFDILFVSGTRFGVAQSRQVRVVLPHDVLASFFFLFQIAFLVTLPFSSQTLAPGCARPALATASTTRVRKRNPLLPFPPLLLPRPTPSLGCRPGMLSRTWPRLCTSSYFDVAYTYVSIRVC